MKYLVETNGPFGLHDLMGGQTIKANRPTVVDVTPFVEKWLGSRLTNLAVLDDAASDATLQMAENEEELEAAIAALPTYKPVAKTAPAAKPATTKK